MIVMIIRQMSDFKDIILEALDVMRRKELAEKQTFKVRAYAKVIAQIKALPRVTSYADITGAGVTGVGEKIEEKIKEILATGSLKSAERAKEEYSLDLYDALLACYGIGPSKARELIETQGIKSIAHLREMYSKMGSALLNDKQVIGLRYYEDLLLRIPRTEMLEHESILRSCLPSVVKDAEIVGSFRRGAADSGDIDMLVCSGKPEVLDALVKSCVARGYITDILALGDKKCMAVARCGAGAKARRLDILLTPPEEYAVAILYFTGSATFNVAFRQRALDRGYTLNEHALVPLATSSAVAPPVFKKEQDIFKFLSLAYTPPEERTGATAVKPILKIIRRKKLTPSELP